MPNQRVVLRARANPKPILCRLSIFDRYVRSCDVIVSYLCCLGKLGPVMTILPHVQGGERFSELMFVFGRNCSVL